MQQVVSGGIAVLSETEAARCSIRYDDNGEQIVQVLTRKCTPYLVRLTVVLLHEGVFGRRFRRRIELPQGQSRRWR
jgi:hypothetical protein